MKKFLLIIVMLVILVKIDFYVANKADQTIQATNANFEARFASAHLDVQGARKQGCQIKKIYYFYWYQTCFILRQDRETPDGSFFQFMYHKPKAISLFYDHSEDSLYFKESYLGQRLSSPRWVSVGN